MSIYSGYKTVLIKAYEGIVLVECPRNMKRSEVIAEARLHFQRKLNKPLTHLNNVEYLTESQFVLDEEEEYESIDMIRI